MHVRHPAEGPTNCIGHAHTGARGCFWAARAPTPWLISRGIDSFVCFLDDLSWLFMPEGNDRMLCNKIIRILSELHSSVAVISSKMSTIGTGLPLIFYAYYAKRWLQTVFHLLVLLSLTLARSSNTFGPKTPLFEAIKFPNDGCHCLWGYAAIYHNELILVNPICCNSVFDKN